MVVDIKVALVSMPAAPGVVGSYKVVEVFAIYGRC